MKKVVSFSLWGTSEVYLHGAVDAIAQVNRLYPGWEPRFYLGADVPKETRQELIDNGASIFDGPAWGPWAGMFWRFLAASDPDVEVMISRDVDTQILPREVEAVNEWLASGKTLHIMRDHPRHEMPVMGGMWGCRTIRLRDMETRILRWNKFNKYGCDQAFLGRVVYPQFRDDSWIHSECVYFSKEVIRPFPSARQGEGYVGAAIREHDLVTKYNRYMNKWIESGKPMYLRPHPWSFPGRLRLLKLIIMRQLT
ncbi:MAG: hypothetical protein WCP35_02280 [Verrucomicrobiota bacterium]